MPDNLTTEQRRRCMSRVKNRHTKPELIVRSTLHRLGYRFRLHRRDLPGSPDVVFPGRRKVIFVHGCFWHRHPGCKAAGMPTTRAEFWKKKFDVNVSRDLEKIKSLEADNWATLIIWSCETKDAASLKVKLISFLG